jgi:hypothetical protein
MTSQTCHHAHPHAHASWLPRLDALGSAASLVCALHCALLPMAAVAMPLTAVELLGNHEFEIGFVTIALAFGAAVLGSGLSARSRRAVTVLFFAAAAFLIAGLATHGAPIAHAVWMTLGGLCLGSAHALNRHSARTHGDAAPLWRRALAAEDATAE